MPGAKYHRADFDGLHYKGNISFASGLPGCPSRGEDRGSGLFRAHAHVAFGRKKGWVPTVRPRARRGSGGGIDRAAEGDQGKTRGKSEVTERVRPDGHLGGDDGGTVWRIRFFEEFAGEFAAQVQAAGRAVPPAEDGSADAAGPKAPLRRSAMVKLGVPPDSSISCAEGCTDGATGTANTAGANARQQRTRPPSQCRPLPPGRSGQPKSTRCLSGPSCADWFRGLFQRKTAWQRTRGPSWSEMHRL